MAQIRKLRLGRQGRQRRALQQVYLVTVWSPALIEVLLVGKLGDAM